MTRRAFCLWSLLNGSCLSAGADARARAEAEKAKQAITRELRIGSSESEIRGFFKRHGWSFDFDNFDQRFRGDVYRAPEKTHAVIVYIYIDKEREFVRSDVQVDITYF